MEESYHDPDNSHECGEVVSHTSVVTPRAIISSIEETHASQPQAQSDLMNNHSEDFIPIDKRKWNDIPAYGDVKRKTLEWNISKMVTNLVRHGDLTDRETVGAVHCE